MPHRSGLSICVLVVAVAGVGWHAAAAAMSGTPARPPASDLVIAEVYGGGSASRGVLTHDYVVLFNRGTTVVSLAGLFLQSADPTDDFKASTNVTRLPDRTLEPGQYFLVSLSNLGVGCQCPTLPPADHVDPAVLIRADNGKVALVREPLDGCGSAGHACPLDRVVDLVGFGSATQWEGADATGADALSSANALRRKRNGCADSDRNFVDFDRVAPQPRNSRSPNAPCGGPVAATTPPPSGPPPPARVDLTSGGTTIRGTIRVAEGAGPHPTLVYLKGMPGAADPANLAVYQAAGFNAVSIDFRGQWSSDGTYSIDGTVADAQALVAWLRADAQRQRFKIDPKRIALVGSSAGTLPALGTAAGDPDLRCVAIVTPFNWARFAEALAAEPTFRRQIELSWSAGPPGQPAPVRLPTRFLDDVIAGAAAYDTTKVVGRLRGRDVLAVGAAFDGTAPLYAHFLPLVAAARAGGAASVSEVIVYDVHNLTAAWAKANDAVISWARSTCKL